MLRNNEQSTTSKGETWSRETNSRLPFDVNVMIDLSIIQISPYKVDYEFDVGL